MDQIQEIPVDKIIPSPYQPRKKANAEDVEDLVASIKASGLLTPIQVRKKGKEFELIAGERRWRAFQVLKKKTIPAIVKDISDFEAMEMSAAENWVRKDLTTPEREDIIENLWKTGKYKTEKDLGLVLGLDVVYVLEYLHSAVVRKATKCPDKVAARTLAGIYELPEGDWQSAVENLAVPGKEVEETRTLVKLVRDSSPDVREQIISPDVKLTPSEKVEVLSIPDEDTQRGVLHRFTTEKPKSDEEVSEMVRVVANPEAKPIKDMVLSVKSPITPKVADVLMEIKDPAEMRKTAQLVVDRNLPADDVRKAVEVVKSASPKVKEMLFDTTLKSPQEAEIAMHYADPDVLELAVAHISDTEKQEGRALNSDERMTILRTNVGVTRTDIRKAWEDGKEIAAMRDRVFREYAEDMETRTKDMWDGARTPEGKDRLKHFGSWDFHQHMDLVMKMFFDLTTGKTPPQPWMVEAANESVVCPKCGKHGRENIGWICCGTSFDEAIPIDDKTFREWNEKKVEEARNKRKEAKK